MRGLGPAEMALAAGAAAGCNEVSTTNFIWFTSRNRRTRVSIFENTTEGHCQGEEQQAAVH